MKKTPSRACEFMVRSGESPFARHVELRCASLARPGSRYCAVHQGGYAPEVPVKPRVKHDLNLDVLPWTADDFARTHR
jgi:hypothetical protein